MFLTTGRNDVVDNASRQLRVFVIDDEELILLVMSSMLKSLGHAVETASSGEQALERFEAGSEADLVVLDLNMPGLDGLETLRSLRALRPELPVLICTGYVDDRIPGILARFEKVRVLAKPFTLAEIRQQLSGFP
jgi:CheY-like chemotaxis protein